MRSSSWLAAGVALIAAPALAQQTPIRPSGWAEPAQPALTAAGPDIWRTEGTDAWSGLRYVRVLLAAQGQARGQNGGPESSGTADLTRTTLTGQCTQEASGKLHFELFVNFGGMPDATFYPPWHSTGQGDLFPPGTRKVTLTLEFLGYTKVKPFKRQFEETLAPGTGQLRYLNPGAASTNMEPPAFFFQYLRSLPTLRLSGEGHTAEFPVAPWMGVLRKEPLCGASGA